MESLFVSFWGPADPKKLSFHCKGCQKSVFFEKFDFRSDFVSFGIHFGSILGASGHHFATFGRSVATLVGRMADASTWLKMGSDWGGGDPVHNRPVPTPSRTLPLSRVGIYRVGIQGRYVEGR